MAGWLGGRRRCENAGDRVIHRLDLVNTTIFVTSTYVADAPLNCPGPVHSLVSNQVTEELGGGGGDVLADEEALGTQRSVSRGRRGNVLLLVPEDGEPDGRGAEGDDDEGGGSSPWR